VTTLGGFLTLDDFAAHCWSNLRVAQKTIANYRGAYLRNVSPFLGKREMSEISTWEFLDVFAPLAAPNYFQTLMATKVLYREAIIRELVAESPVAHVKAPKSRPNPQKFLTWDQVSTTNFGKYDRNIKFLALHGLRWSEAVVLTADDIYNEKVHITKSSYGPTKTTSGIREVPYFGYFAPFPKTRKAIAKSLAVHGVTIHSLRKTYAYFLKTNNVHVTAAAKFLGHSDPLITLKIYTLVLDNEIDEIGTKLRGQLKVIDDQLF
jgi:integrase